MAIRLLAINAGPSFSYLLNRPVANQFIVMTVLPKEDKADQGTDIVIAETGKNLM